MKPFLSSLIAAALIGLASPAFAHGDALPEAPMSPVEIVTAFGAALDAGDEAALVSLMATDIQIAESGGLERSLEEYRSHHMGADIEFSKAVETTIVDRKVYESEGLATVMTEAVSKGTFRDKPVNSRLMETMVLQEFGGAWKIVHIHWSSATLAKNDEH